MRRGVIILICLMVVSMWFTVNAEDLTTIQPPIIVDPIRQLLVSDAPSELKLIKAEYNLVSLQWKDNSTTETKYVIERKTLNADYIQLAVLGKDATTYNDASVEQSTTYYYRVKAGTDVINRLTLKITSTYTESSNEIMVKTPASSSIIVKNPLKDIVSPGDLILPPIKITPDIIPGTTPEATPGTIPETTPSAEIKAPEALEAEAVSENEIALFWEDKSDNESGFILYRTYTGEWEEAARFSANVTTYTDKAVQPNTKYYYVIYAYIGDTSSKESNIAEVTTPNQAVVTTAVDLTGASSWAVEELTKAVEYGLYTDRIMNNYSQNITREEFCELVIKLYEKMKGTAPIPVSPNPFNDTANESILKANGVGIVKGTSADLFSPNNSITRQDICVMLYRAITSAASNVDTSIEGVTAFIDESFIGSWAVREVKFAFKNNIMKGSDSKIMPRDNTNREQSLLLVKRVYEAFSIK